MHCKKTAFLNSVLIKRIFACIVFFCLNSCTTPAENFSQTAIDLQYHQQLIKTQIFEHQIFANPVAHYKENSNIIHVYLDGDGTPWEHNRWPAIDPTSRNPMILNLMQLDRSPAILLGRPCYHGLHKNPKCSAQYWTSHRYSSLVVQSMAQALRQWLAIRKYNQVILIGYSGGGVLAMLLAKQVPKLKTVVTFAANLNVNEWSRHHGYLPLQNSLNPADHTTETSQIHQLHIAASEDKIVPPYIIEQFANSQANAEFLLVPNQDHRCCWTQVWPEILKLF